MNIPPYEELFRLIKFNFWLLGIPFDIMKIKTRYFVLLISLTAMVAAEGAFLFSKISSENLLKLTELAPCTCIGLLSILKILAITYKRKKIYKLTEHLGCLYVDIQNDVKKKTLVRSKLMLLKLFTKYFFVLNWVLISVYNFSSPILMLHNYIKNKEVAFILPYNVLLPFRVDSWLPWVIVYTHSIFSGFICVLYFTTTDLLYCVLTTQICSNFSIISDKLKRINKTNVDLLKEIIKDHQYILKLSDDLEDIFTAPNLFNVLVGSVEICALGFNLTKGEWNQIPGYTLFLVSVLLQILIMSVFGENIISESTKVGDAAYLCKWYEMDKKSKKTILTIMKRSQKPQKLTAYKFSVISYGSFSKSLLLLTLPIGFLKIISTSWSYFTILRTVYIRSEEPSD